MLLNLENQIFIQLLYPSIFTIGDYKIDRYLQLLYPSIFKIADSV